MYSDEISYCLAVLNVAHTGVYPADRLPQKVPVPCAIVINTDVSSKPGSHWVSIYINEMREMEYLDSYGRPPFSSILHFIQKNARISQFNNIPLQGTDTAVCGMYCIMFLYFRSKGHTFEQFLSLFSRNTKDNDIKIEKLFKTYFNKSSFEGEGLQTCRSRSRGLQPYYVTTPSSLTTLPPHHSIIPPPSSKRIIPFRLGAAHSVFVQLLFASLR